MVQLSFLRVSCALAFGAALVLSAPVPRRDDHPELVSVDRRQTAGTFEFPELPFSEFDISTTPGGNAAAEAAAVFLDPFSSFSSAELAALPASVEDNIAAMRTAAEDAETELFNPAIDQAKQDGRTADQSALEVGKTKNKVLKHTAFLMVFNIRLAKAQAEGADTSDILADIATREGKLKTNADADAKNAGKASASPLSISATAAPVARVPRAISRRQSTLVFPELPYSQFQISSTPGGIAAQEAAAQFLAPFNSIDLTTVPESVETALANMREAAEAAELDQFNPAIEAASGAEAAALEVGKTKNKVLKHTIFLQIFNIRLAKAQAEGKDTSKIEADLADRQKKLATNTALDQANRGKASKSVV